jgi:hypothetical protein
MGRCCATKTRVLRVPASQLPAFLAQLKARTRAQAAAAAAQRKKEAAATKQYAAHRARNKKRRSRGQSEEEDTYDDYELEYPPAPVYTDTLDASFSALWAAAPPGTTLRFTRHGSEPPADDLWGEWQAALPLNTLPGAASGAARALPPGAAAQDGGLAAAGALLQAGYLVLPPNAVRVALAALRASGPGPCLRASGAVSPSCVVANSVSCVSFHLFSLSLVACLQIERSDTAKQELRRAKGCLRLRRGCLRRRCLRARRTRWCAW